MGRRRQRGNAFAQRKRDKKEQDAKRRDGQGYVRTQPAYDDIVRGCPDFETYYKTLEICPESEWSEFLTALKSDLPTSFRITGSRDECLVMLKRVKELIVGDDLSPVNLPWYPDELAWQIQLTRKDIRRSEVHFKLHNFLISETASGNISRQEAVSMIPPLALDVKSHHKVLDMCAAPGSKTAQLIEALHQTQPSEGPPLPEGFVIANDCDNNRCYMLVHQAKRLNSPCSLIVNHDATIFPNLEYTDPTTSKLTPVKYDRILCDVPCSGDGTLRKNPDIWLKWTCANGNNLHGIQSRIIRRGAELLKVGGRLVYSTCSLNPVENEAVVCRLLMESEGSLELVDPRNMLPGLKHVNGMTKWKPASKDLVFYDKFEDVPEKWLTCVRPSMFPPSEEVLEKLQIQKCIRILPHLQNTGGFFIAVIKKTKPLPWETIITKQESSEIKSVNQESQPPPLKKRRLFRGFKEDPFIFFNKDEEVYKKISQFYEISDDFKSENLLTRSMSDKKKNIYFCNDIIRSIVLTNEHKLKIINTGVKIFVRCDNKNMDCAYRLGNEGLISVLPFLGEKRLVTIQKSDLIQILLHNNPQDPPDITILDPETQKKIAKFGCGSCFLKYVDTDLQLYLSGWKGTRSLRAYVNKDDTVHMLRLLGEDTSKYEVNKFNKQTEEDGKVDIEVENNEPTELSNEQTEKNGENMNLE